MFFNKMSGCFVTNVFTSSIEDCDEEIIKGFYKGNIIKKKILQKEIYKN